MLRLLSWFFYLVWQLLYYTLITYGRLDKVACRLMVLFHVLYKNVALLKQVMFLLSRLT